MKRQTDLFIYLIYFPLVIIVEQVTYLAFLIFHFE